MKKFLLICSLVVINGLVNAMPSPINYMQGYQNPLDNTLNTIQRMQSIKAQQQQIQLQQQMLQQQKELMYQQQATVRPDIVLSNCKERADFAKQAIYSMQVDMPIKDVIDVIYNGKGNPVQTEALASITYRAYSQPTMTTTAEKEEQAKNFSNSVFVECIKSNAS